ncbi:hypothetical protein NECID01_0312 [Nematocida sp. AWRm77]|nr:hypothetical protein NECID01_0312 [Nematocida sp. AWRm77]
MWQAMGKEKSSRSMKNLMIHSGVFELYYKQKPKERVADMLAKVGCLYKFDVVEIVNAKLCCRKLIDKNAVPAESTIDLFWVCCLLSRKFWTDAPRKNADEAESLANLSLQRINWLEKEILARLEYDVWASFKEIKREIQKELSVDLVYKRTVPRVVRMSRGQKPNFI